MESLDLSNLSAEEYEKIMNVMRRDQMLRKQEEQRILQFKAVSGEWMKELTRSASEKIRSPSTSVFATATENLGRSLKYSFRSGFLKQNNSNLNNQPNEGGLSINSKIGSNSESQLHSPSLSNQQLDNISDHQPHHSLVVGVGGGGGGGRVGGNVIGPDQTNNLVTDCNSSSSSGGGNYRRFYRSRGQLPPKLPPTVNTTSGGGGGDSLPSKSPPSDESGSQETSPKPPLSPVIKAYQAAFDLVATDTSRTMLNTAPGERKTVYRKVSNRLLDSSSSEEEEEEDDLRPSSHSRASSESTPSPRTPNSCKILSGISANQATAFKFPPLSPVPSRSSLRMEKQLERIPMEHQSSDEFSATPLSSFRSRSTSSETPDETSTSGGGGSSSGGGGGGSGASKVLALEGGTRNRRISPLRKQRAIAEELQADLPSKIASACQINTSGIDSSLVGFTGNDYSTIVNPSPNISPSMTNSNITSELRRDHSGGIDSGIECNYPIGVNSSNSGGTGANSNNNNRSRKGSSWTSWYNKDKPPTDTSALGSSKKSPKGSSMPGTPLATYSRFNQILANNNSHSSSSSSIINTVGATSRSSILTDHIYNLDRSLVTGTTGKAEDEESENEGTVENTTGVVFRKVTIKKRLSRTQSDRGTPSPTGSPTPLSTAASMVTPPSPLISPRSTTNSPDLQVRQSQQPRYTQSPCCSPVPPIDHVPIIPTINSSSSSSTTSNQNPNSSINRSLTDDPCRRTNGAVGTYIKSHSADEKSSTRRLITNRRKLIGGSEPCPANESTSAVPHISVSDYSESFSYRGSIGSSGGGADEIFTSTEDDVDKAFAFHNRSQTSLSSFVGRSESLSSVYSAAGGGRYGTVTVSGEILFSLAYKQSESSLELYIKECRNLSPVDCKRNRSDPYVKLYLLPDRSKSGKRKTKVKKHTLNPVFDENLKLYLPANQLEGRTLWISVWHSDIFGRNDFLGEVTLPLTRDILRSSGLRWYPLQERIDPLESNPVNYRGGIFIALKFVPTGVNKGPGKPIGTPGKLLVMVKEAHSLTPTRSNGTSDPFVKCYLLPDKSKKLKTPVIKKTVNPRWNHTFEVTDITTNDLQTRCLELTIWDYDKLTSNDFLGGVRLSLGQGIFEGKPVDWLDSTEEETTLWKQLLDKTDLWVYGELPLRTSLQSRSTFGR